MNTRINWFGIAGGSLTLAAVVISSFIPWWSLNIEGFLKANISPLNSTFSLLNNPLTVPLVTALTIVGLLSLIASGIVMLIYSVVPMKTYSKHLLGFAYRKPLYSVIFFVLTLFAISTIAQIILGLSIPLSGSATLQLPESFTRGASISFLAVTGFSWLFWLVVVAAGFCIAARLYHPKLTTVKPPSQEQAKTTETPQSAAPPKTPTPEIPQQN